MVVIEVRAHDIVPIGCVIYQHQVFSGAAPFADSTPASVTTKVLLGERPERPKDPTLTDELWDLVRQCLEQDPRRRPEITGVISDLERALAVRRDSTDVEEVHATTLENTRQREPSYRASSFIAPFQAILTGLEGTRSWILTCQLWQRCKLKRASPESEHTSDTTCGVEPNQPRHSLRGIELGNLDALTSVRLTSSSSHSLLRRVGFWILSCGVLCAHDRDDYLGGSWEK